MVGSPVPFALGTLLSGTPGPVPIEAAGNDANAPDLMDITFSEPMDTSVNPDATRWQLKSAIGAQFIGNAFDAWIGSTTLRISLVLGGAYTGTDQTIQYLGGDPLLRSAGLDLVAPFTEFPWHD